MFEWQTATIKSVYLSVYLSVYKRSARTDTCNELSQAFNSHKPKILTLILTLIFWNWGFCIFFRIKLSTLNMSFRPVLCLLTHKAAEQISWAPLLLLLLLTLHPSPPHPKHSSGRTRRSSRSGAAALICFAFSFIETLGQRGAGTCKSMDFLWHKPTAPCQKQWIPLHPPLPRENVIFSCNPSLKYARTVVGGGLSSPFTPPCWDCLYFSLPPQPSLGPLCSVS